MLLLPGRTRSLRSVSVILTSPPQQAKRARSGSLQLHSAQGEGGETNLLSLGGTRNRPRPRKITAPVPCSPQTPFLPPPNAVVPAARMTVECASKTSAHDRGKCTGRRAPRGRRIQGRAGCPWKPPRCARPGPPRLPDAGACKHRTGTWHPAASADEETAVVYAKGGAPGHENAPLVTRLVTHSAAQRAFSSLACWFAGRGE